MNDWMKDDKIKEILLDDKTVKRNFFKREQIESYLILRISNEGKSLMLVNIEIWMRSFID